MNKHGGKHIQMRTAVKLMLQHVLTIALLCSSLFYYLHVVLIGYFINLVTDCFCRQIHMGTI